MEGGAKNEIERTRSAWEIFLKTFALYRRFPWLFLVLAAVVVIPYDFLSLLARPGGPLHGSLGVVTGILLFIADTALVVPLISALHVHAVADVRRGLRPTVGPVARRGLKTLPMVCAAAAASWLGVTAGFLALVVPGVLLYLRWSVVAQAATLGADSWRDALRWSSKLTKGHYLHIFGLLVLTAVTTAVPDLLTNLAFGIRTTTVASFTVRTCVAVATSSFTALALALLYYDLASRYREVPQTFDAPQPGGEIGDPLTPFAYADENRPSGWYIDQSEPGKMRYWGAGDDRVWSQGTAKTPGQTLVEWQNLKAGMPAAEPGSEGAGTTSGLPPEPTGHPLDPASYSDEDRPPGWYVDPDKPWRMRYWAADGTPTWSKRTTKTPKDVQEGWRDLRWKQ
jgi:hypothetical protein